MKKIILVVLFIFFAIGLSLGFYYFLIILPEQHFLPENSVAVNWKDIKISTSENCKQIALSTDQEKDQYKSKLLSHTDVSEKEKGSAILISLTSNERESISVFLDPGTAKCWVIFVGDYNGNGEILFEDQVGNLKKTQVTSFQLP